MESLSPEHFEILSEIGQGSFGQVVRARKRDSGDVFAIKIVEKSHLKRENKVKQAHIEKSVLMKLRDHPGIIHLFHTFQDAQCLYFVMELCEAGDLVALISRLKNRFPYELAVHYTAEIVGMLEFLRANQIAHRDLKPENILVANSGHLRMVDFGSARDYSNEEEKGAVIRRNTFVGTAEYVSPEVLADEEVGPPVDLWALGCILYQMLVGQPPFKAKNDYLIFEQIRSLNINYPPSIPPAAADLVRKLLVHNPRERLGAGDPGSGNDFRVLKAHPLFEGVNFSTLFTSPVPGYIPPSPIVAPTVAPVPIPPSVSGGEIVLTGAVKKKAGWVYKQRRLEVTNEPRIRYYDLGGALKGEIEISPELRVEVRSKYEFSIVTPKRTYYFKEISGNPDRWMTAISPLIASLPHK